MFFTNNFEKYYRSPKLTISVYKNTLVENKNMYCDVVNFDIIIITVVVNYNILLNFYHFNSRCVTNPKILSAY